MGTWAYISESDGLNSGRTFITCAVFFFFLRFLIYLFIETEREREAETQAEGEAGSMQRA